MDNNLGILIAKKIIQKEFLNVLYNKGLIDFINTSNIIKKLDKDINKLKELQDMTLKNIIIKILV